MKNKNIVKYQFTKIANDMYNVYNTFDRTGDFKNSKELCSFLVEKRGGISLNQDFYDMLSSMEDGDTFGIAENAFSLTKTAKNHGIEPWKLESSDDGMSIFVRANTGCEVEEDEEGVKKTASVQPITHTYKIAINAKSFEKASSIVNVLNKIGCDDSMYINPLCPETVVFDYPSTEMPSKTIKDVQDTFKDNCIDIEPEQIECCHDYCTCGKNVFDFPQLNKGELVLIIPDVNPIIGTNLDSLKDYAIKNEYPSFKVCADDESVVFDSSISVESKEEKEIEKEAESVFEDEATGKIYSAEDLKTDPNIANDTKLTKKEVTAEINNIFSKVANSEGKKINISSNELFILRYALRKGLVEKIAYLSDDAFSIKANDAVCTVDNDGFNYSAMIKSTEQQDGGLEIPQEGSSDSIL